MKTMSFMDAVMIGEGICSLRKVKRSWFQCQMKKLYIKMKLLCQRELKSLKRKLREAG